MSIIDHLRAYAVIQHKLIKTLMGKYNCEPPFFDDVPKRGLLPVGDELWEFQKHGAGVSFTEVITHKIVDAHIDMTKLPEGIDAWRLLEYFESLGVNSVKYRSEPFAVSEEKYIDILLKYLYDDGLLVLPTPNSKTYCIRDQAAFDEAINEGQNKK